MFQLTEEEVETMVSQNAIPSKQHLGGALPYVFTEHGVLQLANVLKSGRVRDAIWHEITTDQKKIGDKYTLDDVVKSIKVIYDKIASQ